MESYKQGQADVPQGYNQQGDGQQSQNYGQQGQNYGQQRGDYEEVRRDQPAQAEPELSLWGYFVQCITKKYFEFEGRARRKEFWGFYLFQLISLYIPYFLFLFNQESTTGLVFLGIYCLVALALIIPGLAVACRRLHDINRSFWYYLLCFVPIIGWIILLVFWCKDGTPGRNKYGEDPKGRASA